MTPPDPAGRVQAIRDLDDALKIIDDYRDGDSEQAFARALYDSTPTDKRVSAAFAALPRLIDEQQQELTALHLTVASHQQEIERLRATLKQYGQHTTICGVRHVRLEPNEWVNEKGQTTVGFANAIPDPQPCSCGLEALASPETRQEPEHE